MRRVQYYPRMRRWSLGAAIQTGLSLLIMAGSVGAEESESETPPSETLPEGDTETDPPQDSSDSAANTEAEGDTDTESSQDSPDSATNAEAEEVSSAPVDTSSAPTAPVAESSSTPATETVDDSVSPVPETNPTVPVTFISARGRRFISVRQAPESETQCFTPCTLELVQGSASIGPLRGEWSSEAEFVVPPAATVATIVRGRRGRGLRIAGISLTVVGAVGVIVGLFGGSIADEPSAEMNGMAWSAIPAGGAFITGLFLLAFSPEEYEVVLEPAAEESTEVTSPAVEHH